MDDVLTVAPVVWIAKFQLSNFDVFLEGHLKLIETQ